VGILITNPYNILAYQAREQTVITSDSQCSTMLFHVTQERNSIHFNIHYNSLDFISSMVEHNHYLGSKCFHINSIDWIWCCN
jgi:hypothetical protein